MGILDNLVGGGKRLTSVMEGVGSVIGQNAKFKGEFHTTGSVNIDGHFEGKIAADGEVIVSPAGQVVGEILGGTVIVSGRVNGHIIAKESLEIAKTGRVHGDLKGGKIIIEDGSSYHGRVKVESGVAEETTQETTEPLPTIQTEQPAPSENILTF